MTTCELEGVNAFVLDESARREIRALDDFYLIPVAETIDVGIEAALAARDLERAERRYERALGALFGQPEATQ